MISWKQAPGYLPICGNCSAAIAAACHVQPTTASSGTAGRFSRRGEGKGSLAVVAMLSKELRWGVVSEPKERISSQFLVGPQLVGHLASGTLEGFLGPPKTGTWYA